MRRVEWLTYSPETSVPAYFRPIRAATTQVVPEPLNGSNTRSPSSDDTATIRSRTFSGIWQGCHFTRSLKVPQTREKLHTSSGILPAGLARLSA